MEFMSSPPDIVRSATQRWLLDHWRTSRDGAHLPPVRKLEPTQLATPHDDLSLTTVVPANGVLRFQIRFHGERIAALFDRIDSVGTFVDEIIPLDFREPTIATYRHAVATGLPVYTVSDTSDPEGRIVHYERLLLPLSRDDDGAVGHILASLETASPEGAVVSQGLMIVARRPAFALYTTIRC